MAKPTPWEIKYDRTVSDDFLGHFAAGGFAESLVDYARGKYPVDFQFRKDPKKPENQTATLYVGLTAVVNLHRNRHGHLRLNVHDRWKREAGRAWDPVWETWASPSTLEQWWPQLERFLEVAIPNIVVDGKYVKTEGIVQASVSAFHLGSERAVIDREVVPGFRDTPMSQSVQATYSAPLVQALETAGLGVHRQFGMECDALAVDATGHLVAIEIKPGSVASLKWVAAQATMYARVIQHWVDNDPGWKDTIIRIFQQRASLGLTPPTFELPALKPHVVPAVAFQRVAAPAYVQAMYTTQDALVAAGVGDPSLTFYAVAPSGRLNLHQRP